MKKRIFLISFCLLIGLSFVVPVTGQTGNIVLEGADESNTLSLTPSQTLINLVSDIGTRFVIEFSDAKHVFPLTSPPSEFFTLLEQVANRFVFQYANEANFIPVSYPKSIINDTSSPVIGSVAAQGNGIVTWTTDEFATSTVIYGTNLVVDTVEITDPLFTKQHRVVLTGLTPGEEYSYRVRSTDRSGNTSTSSEYSFTPQVSRSIYIPIVNR